MRKGTCERAIAETTVRVAIDLDGNNRSTIYTGIRRFDELLEHFAFRVGFDLWIEARSHDCDDNHLIEDTAIALACAIADAIGDRSEIKCSGRSVLYTDSALAHVSIDLSRSFCARVNMPLGFKGAESVEVAQATGFFRTLALNVQMEFELFLLTKDLRGGVDMSFDVFARALSDACRPRAYSRAIRLKGMV